MLLNGLPSVANVIKNGLLISPKTAENTQPGLAQSLPKILSGPSDLCLYLLCPDSRLVRIRFQFWCSVVRLVRIFWQRCSSLYWLTSYIEGNGHGFLLKILFKLKKKFYPLLRKNQKHIVNSNETRK